MIRRLRKKIKFIRSLKAAITFLCFVELLVFGLGLFLSDDVVATHDKVYSNPYCLGVIYIVTPIVFITKYIRR